MIRLFVTFGIGVLFALGFGFGGVTRPETIVNFLDFAGNWDPAVMAVMGTAVPVTLVAYRLIFRRKHPILEAKFAVPTRRDIDTRLVAGAALFGAGWGLIGFCPGPALASLPSGNPAVLVWVVSMFAGMFLFGRMDAALKARAERRASEEKARQERERAQGDRPAGPANPATAGFGI